MSMIEIQEAAFELSERERAELALWLLDTLPPALPEDELPDTLEEARRRRDQISNGEVIPIRAEEFWNSIKAERARWK
jgi:hypothetical protein